MIGDENSNLKLVKYDFETPLLHLKNKIKKHTVGDERKISNIVVEINRNETNSDFNEENPLL